MKWENRTENAEGIIGQREREMTKVRMVFEAAACALLFSFAALSAGVIVLQLQGVWGDSGQVITLVVFGAIIYGCLASIAKFRLAARFHGGAAFLVLAAVLCSYRGLHDDPRFLFAALALFAGAIGSSLLARRQLRRNELPEPPEGAKPEVAGAAAGSDANAGDRPANSAANECAAVETGPPPVSAQPTAPSAGAGGKETPGVLRKIGYALMAIAFIGPIFLGIKTDSPQFQGAAATFWLGVIVYLLGRWLKK